MTRWTLAGFCGAGLLAGAASVSPPALAQSVDTSASSAEFVAPELLELPDLPFPAGAPMEPHDVVVEILIDVEGRATEARTVSGEEPFLSLTMDALIDARFRPATEDGTPVPVRVPFTWQWTPPPLNVTGVVLAKGGQGPAAGLVLRIGESTATTDELGAFALRGVPSGDYAVELLDEAWFLPETQLSLGEDETVHLELWAIEKRADNEAVGIYTKTPDAIIRRTITKEDIRINPGTMGDPVRALQNQPSILRTPLEAGWVLVRGGNTDDTAVFIDGIQVPLLFHLGGFTSIIHPEMVDAVQLYPNAYPARLGNATSGAVELTPRRVGSDERSVAGFNLIYASAFAEVPVGEAGGLAIAARRSYLDGALALVVGSDQATIAPRFWDWQVRTDGKHAGFMFVGMSDNIDTPTGNGDETVSVTQSGWLMSGRATIPIGADSRIEIRPWYAHQEHDLETELLQEQETRGSPGLRADIAGPLADVGNYIAGAEGRLWQYRITRASYSRFVPIASAAPYAEVTVGSAVQATLGARGDVLTMEGQLPRTGFSPRGAVQWKATDTWTLVAEAGQYHQAPPFVLSAGLPEGPYLGMERSYGPSGGVHYATGHVALGVDAYLRRAERIAAFEEDGSLSEGDGRAYGVELSGRARPGQADLSAVYQYGRSEFREDRGDLFQPYRFDQPHRLLLLGTYRLPRQWTLASRFRYSSGFTLIGEVDTAFDILTQEEVPFEPDTDRLDAFHSLDVKVSKRFLSRRWQLDTYLDIQNLYWRRVAEPVINGFDDSKPVYGFGLPMLPIFGIEAIIWPGD